MSHLWPTHLARDAAFMVVAFLLVLWVLVRAVSR
jgi:hypothetical protein